MLNRRQIVAALPAVAFPFAVRAQEKFLVKPIKIVISVAPAGGVEAMALSKQIQDLQNGRKN
jgi:hypothetical protein